MKKLLLVLVLIALASGAWWALKEKGAAAPVTHLEAVAVERGDLEISVQASGEVQPQNRVVLKPPFAGRLEQVLFAEGAWVKKGQVLAWLSSSERAALLDAARARGPEEVKKWEEIYKPTPMLAPISGTLIARTAEPGQTLSSADAVLTLSDRLIIKANVDETDIAKVRVGQPCRLALDAYPGQPFNGRAVHVAFEATTVNNVTLYAVDVAADRAPSFMRAGMTASVNFVYESRKDVLVIPSEALQAVPADGPQDDAAKAERRKKRQEARQAAGTDGPRDRRPGQRAVVLVPDPSVLPSATPKGVTRAVRLGLSDGQRCEVLEGLKEGETVLVLKQGLPQAAATGKNPFLPSRPPGARAPRVPH